MTTGRRRPSGKRLFSEEQAQALIKAYDDGATQQSFAEWPKK